MDDARQLAAAARFRPRTASARDELFERLDPDLARVWRGHVGRLLAREQLDVRTRFLVFAAQYTMLGETEILEEVFDAALDHGVEPAPLFEAIVQCYTYAGERRLEAATGAFERVVAAAGRLDELAAAHQQRRERAGSRDLEAERDHWAPEDRDDPRLPGLLERYGWRGLSTGLRLRPGHVVNLASTLDALDPAFLEVWLDTVHEGLYSRGVLDDATRLLCVVGSCYVAGESYQARRHVRSALRAGARPDALLEVAFQSMATVGHPGLMPLAIDDLITILDEEGRLDELVAADRLDEVRDVTRRRVASRSTTRDVQSAPR